MLSHLKRSRWTMLLLGLVVGATIGAVVAVQFSSPRIHLPATLLNATATSGGTTMAIATGPIQEGVEGLFILDFITGELTCSVLNPRTGAIGGAYQANVVADLGVEQGKAPQYLMVTGAASFKTQGGHHRTGGERRLCRRREHRALRGLLATLEPSGCAIQLRTGQPDGRPWYRVGSQH